MAIQSLDRDELLALLRYAREKSFRDWLLILIAFCHGLRASEVVHLKASNFSSTHITVQRLKGSLKTSQDLHEDPDPLLNERAAVALILRNARPNQRLFKITRVRFWQIFQEHAAAAGIAKHKRHPHVLKHSIAMQTIEKAGIENVRQYLGHKSIGSTGEYLKVTDDAASSAVGDALKL